METITKTANGYVKTELLEGALSGTRVSNLSASDLAKILIAKGIISEEDIK